MRKKLVDSEEQLTSLGANFDLKYLYSLMNRSNSKTIVLIVISVLSLFIAYDPMISITMSLISAGIAFLLGILSAPLAVSFSLRNNIAFKRPSWNQGLADSPYVFIQYMGYLFIAAGSALFLGTILKLHTVNGLAITLISAGMSCLIGLYLVFVRK